MPTAKPSKTAKATGASATKARAKSAKPSPSKKPALKKPAAKKPPPAPPVQAFAWLVKSEPSAYSFARMQKEKHAVWDGVRNYEARNNLRAMKVGELAFFYHSNEEKAVVGLVRIAKEAYQDPSTTDDFSVVEVEFDRAFAKPVTLGTIKAHPLLGEMEFAKKSRLSVSRVTKSQFEALLALAS